MFKSICGSVILAAVLCCNIYRFAKTGIDGNKDGILQAPSMIIMSVFFKPFVDQISTILVENFDQIGNAAPLVFLASIVFALAEYTLIVLYALKVVDYFFIQPFFRVIRITAIFSIVFVVALAIWLSVVYPSTGTYHESLDLQIGC